MITGVGRPLRFVGALTGGWVALRTAMLWGSDPSVVEAVDDVLPIAIEAGATTPAAFEALVPIRPRRALPSRTSLARPQPHSLMPEKPAPQTLALGPIIAPTPQVLPVQAAAVSPVDASPSIGARPQPSRAIAAVPNRISVSSWLIARSGMGVGSSAFSPQLGGTQGGVRIDYALVKGVAATARIAAPAAGAGRELSLGIAWRPAGVPVRIVAEQRIALDGARGGPSLGISGGVNAAPLPAGFRLEGYAQAGAILRDGVEHFADGSARVTRPVSEASGVAIDIGAGAWGGVQRGVARLDLGPTIGARIPIAGQRLRVAVDWRQRVAGRARPGSGPALTMGMDF